MERYSLIRPSRHLQAEATFVSTLDLLFLDVNKPLQSQTPVLGHSGVQVL